MTEEFEVNCKFVLWLNRIRKRKHLDRKICVVLGPLPEGFLSQCTLALFGCFSVCNNKNMKQSNLNFMGELVINFFLLLLIFNTPVYVGHHIKWAIRTK